MNAKSAVFALISIRSQPLRTLVTRLPYAMPTVYKAVHQLEEKNMVRIENGTVMVVQEYEAQKLSNIYIQCLTHGIDPEFLTRPSTLLVWKSLEKHDIIREIVKATGLSIVSVKKILTYLHENDIVLYSKRKPIVAEYNTNHQLNRLLSELLAPKKDRQSLYYPGEVPYREIAETPDEVERILYQQIDGSLSVKDTGFLVKGSSDRLTILESVDGGLSHEENFLRKVLTTEGVEDICVLMVKQNLLNYDVLLKLAIDKKLVNVIGCYLDILYNIDKRLVPSATINKFLREKTKKRRIFLSQDKKYGKSGWEAPYEDRWNVDLYLEFGGIEHGVRGL